MRRTNSKEVKKYFDEYLNDILTDNFDGNIDLMAKQFVASCCDGEGKLYRKYNCLKSNCYNKSLSYLHKLFFFLVNPL